MIGLAKWQNFYASKVKVVYVASVCVPPHRFQAACDNSSCRKCVVPFKREKVRFCEIMSGGFAVKIQQSVKKCGGLW